MIYKRSAASLSSNLDLDELFVAKKHRVSHIHVLRLSLILD